MAKTLTKALLTDRVHVTHGVGDDKKTPEYVVSYDPGGSKPLRVLRTFKGEGGDTAAYYFRLGYIAGRLDA